MKRVLQKFFVLMIALWASSQLSARTFTVDGLYYNVISEEDKTCAITKYPQYEDSTGLVEYEGAINIPDVANGYKVVEIEPQAFSSSKITSIIFGKNVSTIGYSAFAGSSLREVVIPSHITKIEGMAFTGCEDLRAIEFSNGSASTGEDVCSDCTSLSKIVFGDNIEYIGESAFRNCKSLTEITIPSTVKYIKFKSFLGCDNLESVKLNKGLFSISEKAFSECSKISYISIPSTVYSIEGDAFSYCSSLSKVTIEDGDTELQFDMEDGCKGNFYGCPIKELYVGRYIRSGYGYRTEYLSPFYGMESLESLTFGNQCNRIGEYMFGKCIGLEDVRFPDGLTWVDNNAFEGCINIKNIDFNKVESLYDKAFAGCKGLKSISIPETTTYIGDGCFSNCISLTEVIIKSGECDNVFDSRNISRSNYESTSVFGGSPIEKIYWGRNIDNFLFEGVETLKYLILGKDIDYIGGIDFSKNINLEKIESYPNLPPTVESDFTEEQYENVTVLVPEDALDNYVTSSTWNKFKHLSGNGSSGIQTIEKESEIKVNLVGNTISLQNCIGNSVLITNLSGIVFYQESNYKGTSINLPSGLFIIKIGNKSIRILVY